MAKEASDAVHQRLVQELIAQFKSDGLEILNAAYEGYEPPYKIGRHAPDIIARNPKTELVSIGEAKLCNDLSSEKTREQFEDFSNRQMAMGDSKSMAVPFHIVTPSACVHMVWTVLAQLGLDKRTDIVVWGPRSEGLLEPVYSEVSIKSIEVKSVSADGMVEVAVHLEGNADINFIRWFREPTTHSSIPSFDTNACRVTIDAILFTVPQNLLKSSVELVREWVSKASSYARGKYEELQRKRAMDQRQYDELERRRKELQDQIDKLHQAPT